MQACLASDGEFAQIDSFCGSIIQVQIQMIGNATHSGTNRNCIGISLTVEVTNMYIPDSGNDIGGLRTAVTTQIDGIDRTAIDGHFGIGNVLVGATALDKVGNRRLVTDVDSTIGNALLIVAAMYPAQSTAVHHEAATCIVGTAVAQANYQPAIGIQTCGVLNIGSAVNGAVNTFAESQRRRYPQLHRPIFMGGICGSIDLVQCNMAELGIGSEMNLCGGSTRVGQSQHRAVLARNGNRATGGRPIHLTGELHGQVLGQYDDAAGFGQRIVGGRHVGDIGTIQVDDGGTLQQRALGNGSGGIVHDQQAVGIGSEACRACVGRIDDHGGIVEDQLVPACQVVGDRHVGGIFHRQALGALHIQARQIPGAHGHIVQSQRQVAIDRACATQALEGSTTLAIQRLQCGILDFRSHIGGNRRAVAAQIEVANIGTVDGQLRGAHILIGAADLDEILHGNTGVDHDGGIGNGLLVVAALNVTEGAAVDLQIGVRAIRIVLAKAEADGTVIAVVAGRDRLAPCQEGHIVAHGDTGAAIELRRATGSLVIQGQMVKFNGGSALNDILSALEGDGGSVVIAIILAGNGDLAGLGSPGPHLGFRGRNGQIAADHHRTAGLRQRIDGGEQLAHGRFGRCAVAGAAALNIDHIRAGGQDRDRNGQNRDQRHDQAEDAILLHFHSNRSFFPRFIQRKVSFLCCAD